MSDTNKFVAKNGILLKPYDGIAQDAILKTNTQGHVVTGATFNDLSNTAHTHLWSDVNNKPTTISGYGITDAYTTAQTNANYLSANTNFDSRYLSANTSFYTQSQSNSRFLSLSGGTISGDMTFSLLTGNTSVLLVNSSGTMYASPVQDMYITDSNTILQLTNSSNWDSSNLYVGPTITGLTGQKYVNNLYSYEYVTTTWFRNKSTDTSLTPYYTTAQTNANFLSANTFSTTINTNGINNTGNVTATTFYGDGSHLTGLVTTNTYTTGSTLNSSTITFNRNDGSGYTINLSGISNLNNYLSLSGGSISGSLSVLNNLTINSFASTATTSVIYVNSSGTLLLGDPLKNLYIDDVQTILSLTEPSNWDANNDYTGPALTGLTSGQKYISQYYSYEYVVDTIYRNKATETTVTIGGLSGVSLTTFNAHTGNTQHLTSAWYDALSGAHLPSTSNHFATMNDVIGSISGSGVTTIVFNEYTGVTAPSQFVSWTSYNTYTGTTIPGILQGYYTSSQTNANFLSANTNFDSRYLSSNTFATTINTNGINNTGNITATTFYGDGSHLTGLQTTDTYVSAFTYSNNKFTLTQSGKSDLSVILDSVTALTVQSHINFNTGSTVSAIAGTLYFDQTENALSYKPKTINNDVTINIGQETVIKIHNNSGFLIPNGTVCHINGSNGLGHPTVELANANSLNLSTGVATHDIPNNSDGFITVRGIVRDLTISGVSNGTDIYLSDTIPGGFIYDVNNLAITSRISKIGKVITTGITTATILVNIQNEFDSLSLTTKQQNIFAGDSMSTGVYEYLGAVKSGITINISSVKGWIVKNTNAHSTNPEVTYVIYSGATGVTITNLSTTDETYILLNSASTIYQQNTIPTPQQRRENILLSKVAHPDRVSIIAVNNIPDYVNSPMSALRDMFKPIKLINDGIKPTINGSNLNFNTTEGYLYGMGINFTTEELNPNEIYISAKTTAQFNYRTQTGGTAGYVTSIDPNHYDLNGNIVDVPSSTTNKSTNQRIYLFPSGNINIQYGQQVYDSLPLAIAGQKLEVFERYTNVKSTAILIGILAVRVGATDLSNPEYALFSESTYFGEVVSVVPTPEVYNKMPLSSGIITDTMDLLQTDPLDNTKLAVKNAFKVLFTNFYDVQNPTYKVYDVPVQTGISFNISTGTTYYVGLTLSGTTPTFIIKPSILDFNQATEVFMGDLFADASNVYYMLNTPYIINDGYSHFRSYMVNRMNTSVISGGDIYAVPGTLKFARNAGKYWRFMGNNDITNSSIITESGITNPTNYYVYNQSGNYEFLTGVDPTKYDVGGVTTTVPDNKWTITYVAHWASVTGVTYDGYQRGDKLFNSLDDVLGNLKMPDLIHSEINIIGIITHVIIIKKECTDLSDVNTCRILKIDDYKMFPAVDQELITMQQTGVISWDGPELLKINTDTTKFDITGFTFGVFDKSTSVVAIKYKYVQSAITGITVSSIATKTRTNVYWDTINKTVIQTGEEIGIGSTTVVKLGQLSHLNNSTIDAARTAPRVYETEPNWQEYLTARGVIKLNGYDVTANSDLSINHTSGKFLKLSAGLNRSRYNEVNITGATSPTIVRLSYTVNGDWNVDGSSTQLDTTKYDDLSGTLKTVPDNKFVNLYICTSPYRDVETVFLIRGSSSYNTINDARQTTDFLLEEHTLTTLFIAAKISIKKGETNLTSSLALLNAHIAITDQFGVPITDTSNNIIIAASLQPGVVSFSGTSLLSAASTTTFNISPMQIVCMDYTTPNTPIKYLRNIAAITGITITNRTTYAASWIGYDWVNSQIVQQVGLFTPIQMQTIIQLGKILHHDHLVIDYVKDMPQTYNTSREQTVSLATGAKKLNGYLLSANGANLFVNHSEGDFLRIGIGSGLDVNYTVCAAQNAFSVRHLLHSAVTNKAIFSATSTTIDVANYESSPGVLSDVAGNRYSNVFFIVFPWRTTQEFYVIRDSEVYTSLQLAESGGLTNGPNIPVDLVGGYCFAYISFNGGVITNLTTAIAAGNASITQVTGMLGGSNSAVNQSLQSTYNSSTTPEIVIDATRDGLTIKNGTGNADNITHLLEGMNATDVVTSFISADGSSYFSSVSATTISATTFYGSLNWSYITSKPTTVSGYGITDVYTTAQTNANYLSASTTLVTLGGVSLTTYNTYTGTTAPSTFVTLSTTQTITGAKTFQNTVNIIGDLYVSGTTTYINTSNMNISNNYITINSGETSTGVTRIYSGIKVDRGSGLPYYFVYDESKSNFRIGQTSNPSASTQAVATREDSPVSSGISFWNPTLFRFDTSALLYWSGTQLIVSGDSKINGLTVGKGGGNITTNTSFGIEALFSNSTGSGNVAIGWRANYVSGNGANNVAIGYESMRFSNNGGNNANVAVGYRSLYSNVTGSTNVAIGYYSLYSSTGISNIGLGTYAGRYAISNNELYIDNRDRTTNTNEKLNAIIYGVMAASATAQTLYLNAAVYINNLYSLPTTSGNSGDILYNNGNNTSSWININSNFLSANTSFYTQAQANANFLSASTTLVTLSGVSLTTYNTYTGTTIPSLFNGYYTSSQTNANFLSANTFSSVINTNGINNTGNITATTYYGDGSKLTGIAGGSSGVSYAIYNEYTGVTAPSSYLSANTFSTQVAYNINTTGNITAVTYFGDGSKLTGIQAGDMSAYYTSSQTNANFLSSNTFYFAQLSAITLSAKTILVNNADGGVPIVQIGSSKPVYFAANWPTVSYNAYWVSSSWRYGAGSSSSYGGYQELDPTTGTYSIFISGIAGNEGDVFAPNRALSLLPNKDMTAYGNLYAKATVNVTNTLDVTGVTTLNNQLVVNTNNIISPLDLHGNINSYVQVNLTNMSGGTFASTDFVATANNGTETFNYIDMGINSSLYADPAFTINGPDAGYLYVSGGSLTIGTATDKDIIFHTNGTLLANERMRISTTGVTINGQLVPTIGLILALSSGNFLM